MGKAGSRLREPGDWTRGESSLPRVGSHCWGRAPGSGLGNEDQGQTYQGRGHRHLTQQPPLLLSGQIPQPITSAPPATPTSPGPCPLVPSLPTVTPAQRMSSLAIKARVSTSCRQSEGHEVQDGLLTGTLDGARGRARGDGPAAGWPPPAR